MVAVSCRFFVFYVVVVGMCSLFVAVVGWVCCLLCDVCCVGVCCVLFVVC